MKKGLFIISYILLQLTLLKISAQNTDIDLHQKYWYYKSRFNNDFVSIGTDAGQSIPFNQRGWYDTYTYTVPSDVIKAGDETAQLGIYIAVLATEYRLLKDKGQDLTKVKHELFCALNAINRVDYYAEYIIGQHPKNPNGTSSPDLNGFFIRGDVPSDFAIQHYQDLNYYNDGLDSNGNPLDNDDSDRGFTQMKPIGQKKTSSSYASFVATIGTDKSWEDDALKSFEESQDQLYYLLLGTTLTAKLVDDVADGSSVFGYGSGETSLQKEAINISDRLIKYVKNSGSGLWDIKNPANGNASVQIGSSALAYAFALDNVGCFIKYGQDFPSYVVSSPVIHNACTDYRNPKSNFPIGNTAWGTLVGINGGPTADMQGFYHCTSSIANCTMESRNFLNTIIQDQINAAQAQISAAIQALDAVVHNVNSQINQLPSWAQNLISNLLNIISNAVAWTNTVISGLTSLINTLVSQLIAPVKINTTQERLINNHYFNAVNYSTCDGDPLASHLGSKAYFGIFTHRVLHQQLPLPNWMQIIGGNPTSITYPIVRNELRSVLEQAPCQGNYNFYPISRPGPEWGAPNRLDRMDPLYRYNLDCITGFLGEYHGLDYMLLHNLYFLSGSNLNFEDLDDRTVSENFPYSNGYFSKTNPKTKGAFEYISSSSTINSNASVDFRAGKSIYLKTNFLVQPGADFHAYIAPYQCSSDGELNRIASTHNNYMEDESPKQKSSKQKTNSEESNTVNDNEQSKYFQDISQKLDSMVNIYSSAIENFSTSKMMVYPIPNNGNFNIAFNLAKEDNVNLEIIDPSGKTIYSNKYITGQIEYPFDFTHYPKGVYIAIAKSTKGETFTQKININ